MENVKMLRYAENSQSVENRLDLQGFLPTLKYVDFKNT